LPETSSEGSQDSQRTRRTREGSRVGSQSEAAARIYQSYARAARIMQQEDDSERRQSTVAKVSESVFDRAVAVRDHLVKARVFQFDLLDIFVESKYFKMFIAVFVILNAIFVGISTDRSVQDTIHQYNMKSDHHVDTLSTDLLFAADVIFNFVFFVELVMRMVAQECRFLVGEEWTWNIFDAVVVILSVVEMSLQAAGSSSSYIRVLRLARVVRSMRMVRLVRFLSLFNKLHAVSLAFLRCRTMLICAVVCLLLLVFVFAIIFAGAVANYISDADDADVYVDSMQIYFSSLPMTMLTLFMSISGGVDWWTVCELLMEVGSGFVLVFLVFIVIAVLAVLNVINAIFVNDAVEATQHDLDLRSQAELAENKIMLDRLTRIFQDMEKDRRDMVSLETFVNHVEDEEMKLQLSLIGLHFCDGVSLFQFLDVDRSRYLTIDQFVMGCLRLKGETILIEMEVVIKQTRDMIMDIQDTLVDVLEGYKMGSNLSSESLR